MSLFEARRRKGLTQDQLAALTGLDQTTISGLELGRARSPRFDTVMRLAKALDVNPEALMFGDAVQERVAS